VGSSPTRGDTDGLWSYSVMVITLDSESSDPGSNPGRTSFLRSHVKSSTTGFSGLLPPPPD
jgi:hypothetical protein